MEQIALLFFHNQIAFGFKLENSGYGPIQNISLSASCFWIRWYSHALLFDDKRNWLRLNSQIEEGGVLKTLAREYSMAGDRIANGMMGQLVRGTVADLLRASVDLVKREQLGAIRTRRTLGLRVEQFHQPL